MEAVVAVVAIVAEVVVLFINCIPALMQKHILPEGGGGDNVEKGERTGTHDTMNSILSICQLSRMVVFVLSCD